MVQYIDKDATMAEIDKLVDKGKYHEDFDCAYRDGKNDALYELKEKIDTLEVKEVEQTDFPEYNKALLEVKSKVDELYEEASIGLNEYDAGLYNGIAETCMKLRGFIKARLKSDEQSKVDFEKEIDDWYNTMGIPVTADALKETARHFIGLGIQARKQE